MDGTKAWYESKTAWANIFQTVTALGTLAHVLTADQAKAIVDYGPSEAILVVMAVLGALGLWGRVVATKRIA